MKSVFFFLTVIFLCSFVLGQSNESSLILDNGVKVYRQKGVEESSPVMKNSEKITVVQKRTVKDWSIDECQSAIIDIEAKIVFLKSNNTTEEEILSYKRQLIPIRARMEELKRIR